MVRDGYWTWPRAGATRTSRPRTSRAGLVGRRRSSRSGRRVDGDDAGADDDGALALYVWTWLGETVANAVVLAAAAGRRGRRRGDGRLRRAGARRAAAAMRIVVVGAGVGGLAAAVRLAARRPQGHRARAAATAPGGKCARGVDARRLRVGRRPVAADDAVGLPRPARAGGAATSSSCCPSSRSPATASPTAPRSTCRPTCRAALAALEAWSPGAGADWLRFLAICAAHVARVGAVPHRPAALAAARLGPATRPTRATRCASGRGRRCARLARATVRDPRLRLVVERFATYAGADPRRAPAALAVAGYVEHAFGAWHPRGGVLRARRARWSRAARGRRRRAAPAASASSATRRGGACAASGPPAARRRRRRRPDGDALGAPGPAGTAPDAERSRVRAGAPARPARPRRPDVAHHDDHLPRRLRRRVRRRLRPPPARCATRRSTSARRRRPTGRRAGRTTRRWFVLVNAPAGGRRRLGAPRPSGCSTGSACATGCRARGRPLARRPRARDGRASAARSTAPRRTGGSARCAARAPRVRGVAGCGASAARCTRAAGCRSSCSARRPWRGRSGRRERQRQRVAAVPGPRRRRRAEAGEQLLGVPVLGAGAAHDVAVVGAAVGVGLRASLERRATARRSPGARRATRRSPTEASRPGRVEQVARPGGAIGAVEGACGARGRIVARVRTATGPSASPGAPRRRPPAGRRPPQRAVPAQRRAAGPSRPRGASVAPARRRPASAARKASSAASSSQTANSAQRRRSADSVIVAPAPVPSSRQKRRPGRARAAAAGRAPCATAPRGASARG